jgi:hypothetical protein
MLGSILAGTVIANRAVVLAPSALRSKLIALPTPGLGERVNSEPKELPTVVDNVQKLATGVDPPLAEAEFGVVLMLAGLLATTYYAGFRQGRTAGYRTAAGIIRSGGFVASFDALQRLESGDSIHAISRREDFCYSTAADLLEYPTVQQNVVSDWFRKDLSRYRRAHAQPLSEQTPTEQRLDRLLIQAAATKD